MTETWRPEDDALLRRLEDEALLERVWTSLAGADAPHPHVRAAGLLAELRQSVDGAVALEQALRGELAPLLRMIGQPPVASLTPRLAHHLALLHAELARALERSADGAPRAGAARAWLCSIAMWLWLRDEETYLRRMADAVAADGLSETDRARAADQAPLEPIGALGRRARDGARELSEPARVALAVLARVGEACAMAECSEAITRRATALARREREGAIDVAIARIDASLEEAIARQAPTDELVSLLFDGVGVWRFTDRDEQVERFLIQRTTPVLWDLYRDRSWPDVRALLRPLEEPVEHMAHRIRRDPTKLAYAAPCAQMLVFRAEVAPSFDAQLALAERAVALCETHRNGRLVLADLLVERGLRRLDTAMPWSSGDALAAAARDIKRAEELYPQLKRLEDAKRRLKTMGRDVDA